MKEQLTDALLDALNAAAGEIISLDPDGMRRLARLQGRVFCLEITAPPLTLYVRPTARGLEFLRRVDAPPDVTLSGTALALASLGRRPGQRQPAQAQTARRQHRVVMRGDAELGQAFRKTLSELDLDWEELLARQIGDTPARKVGNALRGLGDWAGESLGHARQNTADYLAEEKQILLTDAAMRRFDQRLDRTRADVDRLTRRIEQIKHALDQRAPARD